MSYIQTALSTLLLSARTCTFSSWCEDEGSVRSIRALELRFLLVVADEIFPYPGVSYFSMLPCSKILIASLASYKYIHPVDDSHDSGDSREGQEHLHHATELYVHVV